MAVDLDSGKSVSFARARSRGAAVLVLSGMAAAIAALTGNAAPADTPLSGDVAVNTTTALAQTAPAVARDADGDIVVAWAGASATDAGNVFMRRYTSGGGPATAEVRVNTTLAGVQANPAVAIDAAGNFVVAWDSDGQDGSGKGVFAQRFSAAGVAQGAEFQVNLTSANNQELPSVALDPAGNFVIAWQSLGQDGSGQGVFARRYLANGTGQGGEIAVNQATAGSQRDPSVAMDARGNFAIAWQGNLQDGDLNGIIARRFAADGTTSGNEFVVNTITTGDQLEPFAAVSGTGRLAVAWTGPDASGSGVYLRRFDVTGQALDAADVLVNGTTSGAQTAASVALDADGDLLVAWTSANQDGSGLGAFARRFDIAGVAAGAEFGLNVATTGDQSVPSIAVDADGDYAAAWQSSTATDAGEILLRRFAGAEPVDLKVTKTENIDPVIAGAPYTYTLRVDNLHAAVTTVGVASIDGAIGAATGVQLTDPLPAGVTFNSASGTGWTCAALGGTVTCNLTGSIPATASSSVTLNVTAPTTAPPDRLITNTGTAGAHQPDPDPANDAGSQDTAVCAAGESAGTFSIATPPAGTDEPALNGQLQVTRNGGTCGAVTVTYTSTDGTAVAGSDYTSVTGTVSWINGEGGAKPASVPVIDDTIDENNETVRVTISNPTRGAIATGGGSADLTILDNDAPPQATFLEAGSGAGESTGSAAIAIQLSQASGKNVTVAITSSGTATNGATGDYTIGTVTIPAGQGTGTLAVTLRPDTIDEDDEEAIFTIGADAGGTSTPGAISQHILTIGDDDNPPTVTFTTASATATEGTTTTVSIVAQLSSASGKQILVPFGIGGTATEGALPDGDFQVPTVSPLTFAPGQTQQTVTITINNDNIDEANETVVVSMQPGQQNVLFGATTSHTTTLVDNDAAVVVNFSAATGPTSTPDESGGVRVLEVQLSQASGQTVTVPFTIGGTAGNGTDYTLSPASPLSFAPGETLKQVTVTLTDDALDEANETVQVVLGVPTNATRGTPAAHTLTIVDNDVTPAVSFGSASQAVAENGGSASVSVQLSAASGRDVTVPYTVSGTATAADASLSPPNPLVIPAGQTQVTMVLQVTDDVAAEPDETVIVTMGAPTNATASTPSQHTFTISDDDATPQVTFTAAAQTAAETAGSVSVTVQLSRPADADVTLSYTLTGSAVGGADFAVTPASPFVIAEGESTATLTVALTDDALDEIDETAVITLSNAVNAQIRSPSQHTVTITDNDAAGVTVTPSGGSTDVTEGGATDTYDVVLQSQPVADVTITATTSGQASAAPASLTFTSANWNVAQTVTVTAANDAVAEGAHADTVANAATSADAVYNGIAVASVPVSITDDDVAGVAIDATGGSTAVTEGGAGDTVGVRLTSQPSGNVTLSVTRDGTQLTRSPATLRFTPANFGTAQVVTLGAIDDDVAEGAHSSNITFSSASTDAAYDGVAIPALVVGITDDDVAAIVLSKTAAAATEGGAGDTYTVRLGSQPASGVTVTLDGGSQVTATPSPLVFSPTNWNLARTVTVTAVNDALAEGAHAGSVTHTAASTDPAYSGLAGPAVTVTLTDNDTAGISVTQTGGNTAVIEGGIADTVQFVLTSQPAADVVIDLSGVPGGQLIASPAQLVFTPANFSTAQGVTVTAVDDALAEGAHAAAVAQAVNSADAAYDAITLANIAVAIGDNDMPGAIVAQTGGTTAVIEGGANDSYTIALNSQPAANVTITLSGGAQLTASPAQLTFTPANFSMPQTVTVNAVDDTVNEGPHTGNVTHTAASTDPAYNALAIAAVPVTITDDDVPGTVVIAQTNGSTIVAEGGAADTITLRLGVQPSANVTVTILGGAQATLFPGSLTFTPANFATPQTVSLVAIDDSEVEGDHVAQITFQVQSADDAYNSLVVAPLPAAVVDNDQRDSGGSFGWLTLGGLAGLLAWRRRGR